MRTLEQILNEHKEWLNDSNKGKRLVYRDLSLEEQALFKPDEKRYSHLGFHKPLQYQFGRANLFQADLSFADLSYADLSVAFLNEAKLIGTDFTNTNLKGASLENAHLEYANFKNADLEDANLEGANLFKTNFINTNLTHSTLQYVELFHRNIRYSHFEDSKSWIITEFEGKIEEFEIYDQKIFYAIDFILTAMEQQFNIDFLKVDYFYALISDIYMTMEHMYYKYEEIEIADIEREMINSIYNSSSISELEFISDIGLNSGYDTINDSFKADYYGLKKFDKDNNNYDL
ncbi:MAG: pentapeptide repeat-containing protein [Methanobrevibacter sp.]|jgi:uncharacterized protein YjbI with pentapeptide repeats|nr:pentapeptide repeat-containing protein [Candidatus Methanovirga meridionalis]